MTFEPPHYEWVATDADAALSALKAAQEMLEAYLKTWKPGETGAASIKRQREAIVAPARLVVALDLSQLATLIKAEQDEKMLLSQVESVYEDLDVTVDPPD